MSKSNPISSWLDRDTFAAWLFLTPALILLGIFLFYPIGYLLYLSFTTGSFTVSGIQWVGWRNYLRLFTDADFLAGNWQHGVLYSCHCDADDYLFPWDWLFYLIAL